MFDQEIIEARRFVLPPIRKPAPAYADPSFFDSAVATVALLTVLAVSMITLV